MNTGTKDRPTVARRIAAASASAPTSPSARYASASSSSASATASMRATRAASTVGARASGTGPSATVSPRGPSNDSATRRTRSTTPACSASSPIGTTTGAAFSLSLARRAATTRAGSAPGRSSLLINASRGTPYRRICRSTVTLWLCTPPTPHKTNTAPSSTRRARSTSMVKSTWPGVSMMLMSVPFHRQNVAAD